MYTLRYEDIRMYRVWNGIADVKDSVTGRFYTPDLPFVYWVEIIKVGDPLGFRLRYKDGPYQMLFTIPHEKFYDLIGLSNEDMVYLKLSGKEIKAVWIVR